MNGVTAFSAGKTQQTFLQQMFSVFIILLCELLIYYYRNITVHKDIWQKYAFCYLCRFEIDNRVTWNPNFLHQRIFLLYLHMFNTGVYKHQIMKMTFSRTGHWNEENIGSHKIKNPDCKITVYITPSDSKQHNCFIKEWNRNKNQIVTKTISENYRII